MSPNWKDNTSVITSLQGSTERDSCIYFILIVFDAKLGYKAVQTAKLSLFCFDFVYKCYKCLYFLVKDVIDY